MVGFRSWQLLHLHCHTGWRCKTESFPSGSLDNLASKQGELPGRKVFNIELIWVRVVGTQRHCRKQEKSEMWTLFWALTRLPWRRRISIMAHADFWDLHRALPLMGLCLPLSSQRRCYHLTRLVWSLLNWNISTNLTNKTISEMIFISISVGRVGNLLFKPKHDQELQNRKKSNPISQVLHGNLSLR